MRKLIISAVKAACALALAMLAAGPMRGALAQDQASPKALALLIAVTTDPKDEAAVTKSDAYLIAGALTQAGFQDVLVLSDPSRAALRKALGDFATKAAKADKAVIYFAGHGLEYDHRNYLVPMGARLARERDIPGETVSLNEFTAAVAKAGRLRVVILDACRNNRFAANWRKVEAEAAANRVTVSRLGDVQTNDAFIAYSARAGSVAFDRLTPADANSPFAKALAVRLLEREDVRVVFDRVSEDVVAATKHRA